MPPFSEAHDYSTAFESDITNPSAGNLPGALAYAGSGTGKYGKPFQDTWYGGFAPRLGLAYQFNQKTMVRASSGIYYANSGNVVPFLDTGAAGYSTNPAFQSGDGGFTPLMYWNTQSFPQNFEKPPAIDPSFLNGQAISYIPRNGDRLPQTLNWVLDIEREVAAQSLARCDVHRQPLDSSWRVGFGFATELRQQEQPEHLDLVFWRRAPAILTAHCRTRISRVSSARALRSRRR